MSLTTRALAFASRWFDPGTVSRVFEPLVADWQREWHEAAGLQRMRVTLRGLSAFICAAMVSYPRMLRQRTPSTVANRIVTRIARFTLVATALLLIPFAREMDSLWWRGLMMLFIVPSAITLAYPFAMITAVDAIRCDHALPPHVERSAVVKLALVAVLFMMAFGGVVTPAANQAWRTATLQASIRADQRSPMRPGPLPVPARGIRELTTYELLTDPSRATADEGRTNDYGRALVIRRELNNRASLAVLPVCLLWLRWRLLELPRRRWSPLPPSVIAIAAVAGYMVLRWTERGVEDVFDLSRGTGLWAPFVIFTALMCLDQWRRARRSRAVA
jgi:hypothetical protein